MMRWKSVGLGLLMGMSGFANQPVGTLSVEKGVPQVERKEKGLLTPRKRERIQLGDQIICAKEVSATVAFDATRKVWRLLPESRVEVKTEGFKVITGGAPTYVGEIPRPKGISSKPPRPIGSTVRGNDLVLEVAGTARQAPLTLQWTAPDWVETGRIEVLDDKGQVRWRHTLSNPREGRFELPASALSGSRWVRVRLSFQGGNRSNTLESWARLLSRAELNQLQAEEEALAILKSQAPTTWQMAQAELSASYGLMGEVRSALDALYPEARKRTDPDLFAGEYWWHLGRLYEQADFQEVALWAYQRAWWHGVREPALEDAIKRLGGEAEITLWERRKQERERLWAQGRCDEALRVGAQVVDDLLNLRIWDSRLVDAVHWQAQALDAEQQCNEAVQFVQQVLERYDSEPNRIERAHLLAEQAYRYFLVGTLISAKRHYEDALAILERSVPDSVLLVSVLIGLGNVALEQGDFVSALRSLGLAKVLCELLAPESQERVMVLNALGSVKLARGDLFTAQRNFEEAYSLAEKMYPNSKVMGECLYHLGVLAMVRRDSATAEHKLKDAWQLFRRIQPDSLEVANCYLALGLISAQNDLEKALADFEEAKKIYEQRAPESLGMARIQVNIGVIALKRGRYTDARRFLMHALTLCERIAPKSLFEAIIRTNLAEVELAVGDLNRADVYQKRAWDILRGSAPNSLEALNNLHLALRIALSRREVQTIEKLHKEYVDKILELISSQALFTPSQISIYAHHADQALMLIGLHSQPEELYPLLPTLRAVGFALETRLAFARSDPALQEATARLYSALEREAEIETDTRLDSRERDKQLAQVRKDHQTAEAEIARLLSARDPRFGRDVRVHTNQITSRLLQMREEVVLVEYLQVYSWDSRTHQMSDPIYVAWVVSPKASARFVKLGSVKTIDQLVREFQLKLSVENPTPQDLRTIRGIGQQLYKQLVEPLGKLPPNVLIVPTGALHHLPFEALVDSKGRYWIELAKISYLGSGRDLVEMPPQAKPEQPSVFAVNRFDSESVIANRTDSPSVSKPLETASRGWSGTRWGALKFAEDEGKTIAEKLGVEPFLGASATEERLLSIQRPRVLHIATHGFFEPYTPDAGSYSLLGAGNQLMRSSSPMVRSGIVLAGANHPELMVNEGFRDGWVTALEISQLDLRGTELVVLSACETGLVEAGVSAGVYGLQRAFRYAGAQTLIMSLIRVDDEATMELMQEFYQGWLSGQGRLEALREAKLRLMQDKRWAHPRFWSSFVLLGDRQ